MGRISIDRVLEKLDEHLHANDYTAAERHLTYWLTEAEGQGDGRGRLLICNELMGLYRKLGRREEALSCVSAALNLVEDMGVGHQVGAATTYLNGATVYKAFGKAEEAMPLFERAEAVYDKELSPTDERRAGLYNNMALALVDLGRFHEANERYRCALDILQNDGGSAPEMAVTHLNMASAAEAEQGLEDAAEIIQSHLERAEALLEGCATRDGNYAFVCEKCASVFGYYGWFYYEKELKQRAARIYEGN